jgi:phage gp29-like protein
VLQPGGTDSASIEGAQALEELMRSANVHELLWHQLESNFYGWAHSEIDWDFSEGMFYPAWFNNAPHRRFIFPHGSSRLLTAKSCIEGEDLIPGRWVVSRARGSNIARGGLMRTAAWFALFKRTSIRDWVVACEKYGIPFLLGKYTGNASPKTREQLVKALKMLGQDGFAVLEDEIEIEVIDVAQRGGDGGLLGNLIGLCEAQLSKTITGATLTADATGNGSWALGKVHSGVRFDLIQSDAAMVAEVMRRYIGEPFMRYNGFPGRAPILKSQIAQEIDQRTRMKLQTEAYKIGLPLSISQMREDHAFRKPLNDEDTLVKPDGAEFGPEEKDTDE